MMVTIGFVGAGKMARTLESKLAEIDGAEVAAVSDVDEAAASALARRQGAAVYTDHEEMYAEQSLDAVVVAIPPFAYDGQVSLAAERGIDVFVEKPVALRPEHARTVAAVIEENGVISGTGYVFRYYEITDRALALLDGRTVGMIDGHYWKGLPASEWGYEFGKSGGQVLTLSTHVFDLARLIGGDVERVAATGTTRVGIEAVDFEDAVTTTMRHENGVASSVSSTVTSPTKSVEVDIHGRDLYLHLDYADQRLSGHVGGVDVSFAGETDGYRREMERFVEAVATNDPSVLRSDYADSARTVELNCAVNDAIREERPVTVR